MNLSHLLRLTDDTGILQHARYSLVARDHGYATDDNARALLFTVEAAMRDRKGLVRNRAVLRELQARYLSFVDHAFDPGSGRFRAYLHFDRTWAADPHSEDADGRAIWALSACAAHSDDPGLQRAARELLHRALPATAAFTSPRAWAYALLGLDRYLECYPEGGPLDLRSLLARRMRDHFESHAGARWPWPEDCLAYDNARLPQALIVSGRALGDDGMLTLGLRVLDWLLEVQTEGGVFAPVGNDGWFPRGGMKSRFDQQPLEALATMEACRDAIAARDDDRWLTAADRAFRWFVGENTLGVPVFDEESGGCYDGITPTGLNQNMGAESTLAWLMAQLVARTLRVDRRRSELGRGERGSPGEGSI